MVGVSEVRKVRAILHQYNVSLGMIVNFQNEKLEVMYVKKWDRDADTGIRWKWTGMVDPSNIYPRIPQSASLPSPVI